MNLNEVYSAKGEYTAKLMIDPQVSQELESVDVTIRNADGSPLGYSFKRWGTKLNLSFVIDDLTPDGVAVIDINLMGKRQKALHRRFCFWIVK